MYYGIYHALHRAGALLPGTGYFWGRIVTAVGTVSARLRQKLPALSGRRASSSTPQSTSMLERSRTGTDSWSSHYEWHGTVRISRRQADKTGLLKSLEQRERATHDVEHRTESDTIVCRVEQYVGAFRAFTK